MSIPNVVLGAAFMLNAMHDNTKDWKELIRKQWKKSRNLPRKKKKAIRKELLIDWSIATWTCNFNF